MAAVSNFYDQVFTELTRGKAAAAVWGLTGFLYQARHTAAWRETCAELREHPLHELFLEDPFSERSFQRPRGYAGDAKMIDFIYSQKPPPETSSAGRALFSVTITSQSAEGVRLRRQFAEQQLIKAYGDGKRILCLACGHFREGKPLVGQLLSNVTVVDQDSLSLDVVRADHDGSLRVVEANVIRFLQEAVRRGESWDYIYTLGLTDYFDDRAMSLFHRLLAKTLAPAGIALIANFVPDHLGVGWMEAVMDWQLHYRSERDLAAFATEAGLHAETWSDPTGSIAWCRMSPTVAAESS